MITRTPGSLVARISLREVSGFSVTVMPAAASSGSVSSKMRPFDSARISCELDGLENMVILLLVFLLLII